MWNTADIKKSEETLTNMLCDFTIFDEELKVVLSFSQVQQEIKFVGEWILWRKKKANRQNPEEKKDIYISRKAG